MGEQVTPSYTVDYNALRKLQEEFPHGLWGNPIYGCESLRRPVRIVSFRTDPEGTVLVKDAHTNEQFEIDITLLGKQLNEMEAIAWAAR